MQGRTGVSWTLELDPEVEDLVDTFTDQLLEEGIVEKILGELRNNNLSSDVDSGVSVSKI